ETANIFATVEGLNPPTTYYFRVKARNTIGVWSDYTVVGSKANGSSAPGNPVLEVYESSITVSYGAVADVDGYVVEASTMSDFSLIVYSSSTGNNLLETLSIQNMARNKIYYMRAGSLMGQATDYANTAPLTATFTIETPTDIVFDEITYNAITASAYAATPGFHNLQSGLSGINVARDGSYAGWHTGGNTWTTKAVMPTARYYLAAAAVGGKIYAIGGYGPKNANEEYDPVANDWTIKADMPTARNNLAAAAAGGKLYAIGGSGGINEEYDPAANTWTTKAVMPVARSQLSAVTVGGKIYAIGGDTATDKENEEYDPAADTWTTKAVMPTGRIRFAAVAIGGRIYAIGGLGGTYKENEEYDTVANVWTTKAEMPTGRYGLAAAAVSGKIYVIGGEINKENEEYDPAADTWAIKAAMPTARYGLATVAAGGKIYAIGGSGGTTRNEEYDPGVAQKFDGLAPDTQYSFKAKAMDFDGNETAETVTVSTYTLAYSSGPASFPGIYTSSITVAWSTGTALGYNGPGLTYRVQASNLANFNTIKSSSETANIFATVEGLNPPTTYYFRVKARNTIGAWGDYVIVGSTANGSSAPGNPVLEVYESSITVSYGAVADVDGYVVEASTMSDFSLIVYSSSTGNNLLETLTIQNIALNAVYYMRAGSLMGQATEYANTTPVTATFTIETPKDIVFDEITYNAITASAYAATPGFSNLESGLSGINVAKDGAYAGWHTGGNTWTTKASMSVGRYILAAAAVGGKLYAIGGYFQGSANEEYDPAANIWTTKANMPTSRNQLAAAAVGGKLYAIGGNAATTKENEEYDPVADIWLTKAVMPTGRYSLATAVSGGKIYAIGGQGGTTINEEYDPETNVWANKATMPTARYYLSAAAVGGKIYAIGGVGRTNKQNEEYDPVANNWTTKTDMPTARRYLAAAAVGGKIYAIGGEDSITKKENEEYDPAANTWATKAGMLTARKNLAVVAVGGKLYAIGGYEGTQKQNEEYDPGVAQKFTGLAPDTEYFFKAKAMDLNGVETAECVEVSTYTLAYSSGPAVFSNVYPSSVTVAWSTGTALGYNGSGATYRVQASNLANFNTIKSSSETANIFATVEGLNPPTTYYFRVKARNTIGVWSDYTVVGSTRNGSAAPLNPVISAVYESSVTVSYGTVPEVDGYVVEASTMSDFSLILYSSSTVGDSVSALTTRDMARNAIYYMRVGSLMGQATEYANTAPATATLTIETPTTIVFDEITYSAITASAYAATPGFNNLQSGLSGINVAIDGAYAGWHVNGDTWTAKAVMPTGRYDLAASAAGGKIYAIGGYNGTRKQNEEYDPAANTWTTKANMPTARYQLASAAVGGKIYVIGGYNGSTRVNTNEEYDPSANVWDTKANMPTARNYLAAAAVGGKVYAIGGKYGSTKLNINEEYDPAVNTWTTKTIMPTARSGLSA
ncbi:MAG: fibronectin type III domain-containing protein, partial [Elusimicrobia bacterium]|nr:fibronectin type III domain-containing protein [Elusimicrobiota bacterium]